VLLGDFTAIDVLWVCLSAFLVVVGLTLSYLLLRLAASAARLTTLLRGLEGSVPALVDKLGGSVDRMNLQLDKVDLVTTSAVDAADAADTAIRAVSMAITRPVQKVAGVARGFSHGTSALFAGHGLKTALEAGREAAARRELEIEEELVRPARAPAPEPASVWPPADFAPDDKPADVA
jgi:hypothetical protein